jgi:hypothetical protein
VYKQDEEATLSWWGESVRETGRERKRARYNAAIIPISSYINEFPLTKESNPIIFKIKKLKQAKPKQNKNQK